MGQNLTITATGGALTDSGAVTVAGLATIVSTGQTVTLGDFYDSELRQFGLRRSCRDDNRRQCDGGSGIRSDRSVGIGGERSDHSERSDRC